MVGRVGVARSGPRAASSGRAAAASGRLRRRLVLLAQAGEALAAPLELEELFRVLYRETARALDASIFILGLYDQSSATRCAAASSGRC